jgi:hypothetical protein
MSEPLNMKLLEAELQPYKKALGKAADTILEQAVSEYPIFVVHQHDVEIGIPLIAQDHQLNWSVNASSLEEFVAKNIIEPEKIEPFKDVYKDPEYFICLFVLSELGANFVFIPRQIRPSDN